MLGRRPIQPLTERTTIRTPARRAAACALSALVLATGTAAVQADPAAESTAAPNGAADAGPPQEIVVTATRHEEGLSKVPISITALTQDSLDQRGIKDFSDVVRFTPGVAFDFLNYNHQTNSYDANGNLLASPAYRYTTGCWPL